MRKWMIAVVAVVAFGVVACGGDSNDGDADGTGGTGGIFGSGGSGGSGGVGGVGGSNSPNPCAADPMGDECMACATAAGECIDAGVCEDEMAALDACDDTACETCCNDEAMEFVECMRSDCPDGAACYTW